MIPKRLRFAAANIVAIITIALARAEAPANLPVPADSWALLNESGEVVTFLRADAPEDWPPPEGHTKCRASELPADWRRAPEPEPESEEPLE